MAAVVGSTLGELGTEGRMWGPKLTIVRADVDRLGGGQQNIGNVMIASGTDPPTAIDMFASLPAVAVAAATSLAAEKNLEEVGSPALIEAVVNRLLDWFRTTLNDSPKDPTDFDALTHFNAGIQMATIRAGMRAGVAEAIERAYIGLLTVGRVRLELEQQAATRYGTDPPPATAGPGAAAAAHGHGHRPANQDLAVGYAEPTPRLRTLGTHRRPVLNQPPNAARVACSRGLTSRTICASGSCSRNIPNETRSIRRARSRTSGGSEPPAAR